MIVDSILEKAKAYPNRPAIVRADGTFTFYGELTAAHAYSLGGWGSNFLVSTTGTVKKKSVVFTEADIAGLMATLEYAKGPDFPNIRSVFTPMHTKNPDACTVVRLYMLSKGITIYAPGGCRDPEVWMDMCREYEPEAIMLSSKQGRFDEFLKARPYNFQKVFVQSGPATPEMLTHLKKSYGGSLYFNYGTMETLIVAGGPYEQVVGVPNCVGKVIPGVTAEIDGGEIRLRTSFLPSGYLDEPEITTAKFKDGWFYPGDLAHFEGDLLCVDGRA